MVGACNGDYKIMLMVIFVERYSMKYYSILRTVENVLPSFANRLSKYSFIENLDYCLYSNTVGLINS